MDDETADRMLAGGVDPADAPPGYAAVATLLHTARSAAGLPVPAATGSHRPVELGLADTASGTHAVKRSRSGRRRIPVLAAIAFCAMTGGAYAAGVSGAGSSTVSAVLDRIGVGSLVGSPSGDRTAASSEAALKGEASAHETTGAATAASVGAGHPGSGHATKRGEDGKKKHGKGHGAEISTLAQTTDAKGVDKGAEISTAASGGKSHAGEHGNGHGGTHPSHPDHPSHPSHPSQPDHPSGGNGGGGPHKPGS